MQGDDDEIADRRQRATGWRVSSVGDETETVEIGAELGRGVRSVVYAFGDDAVLKVPNRSTPEAWLLEELRIADSAARVGAPVPGGRRAVRYGERMAMVSGRVHGPSMGEVLRHDSTRAIPFGRELARIQLEVWDCVPSYELPLQRDRLDAKIVSAAAEFGDDLLVALDVIADTGGELVLCHGDLHPRNVLLANHGPVLVDWFDAARGIPAADVARTELVLRSGGEAAHGLAGAQTLGQVADAYRTAIIADGRFDVVELERWNLVQSIARLAEGFGAHRIDELRSQLRAQGA